MNNRYDQVTVGQRHGDTQVNMLFQNDFVAVDRSVHVREFSQCLCCSFRYGRHESECYTFTFEKCVFRAVAPFYQTGDVGFDNSCNVGRHFFRHDHMV